MSNNKSVVPPPYEVAQRAWECAYVLRTDHHDRIPIRDLVYVEVAYRTGPEGLGWHEIARLFVLFGDYVRVRV